MSKYIQSQNKQEMEEPLLTIELVPKSCFFKNLRSELTKEEWDFLRRKCYQKAGYKCEICGSVGLKWPVEAHEAWYYDDKAQIQVLKGMIALCPNCHGVKHIGLAQIQGKFDLAIDQLSLVNKWSTQQVMKYIEQVFEKWEERSEKKWTLNIEWVNNELKKFRKH